MVKRGFLALVLFSLMTGLAPGQTQTSPTAPVPPATPQATPPAAAEDSLALSPARFELLMLPGTERTVVTNIIYNSVAANAKPLRIMAYLNDWEMLPTGKVEFFKPGTRPNSASPWIIYSPTEVGVAPSKVHSVRVTISVPKDATPGDHHAALLIEERPDNIRLRENAKQMVVKFRLAAIFYIMVPHLTAKGALRNLRAESDGKKVVVVPTLRNDGNSHIRPVYTVRVLDQAGALVAEIPESEALPVTRESETSVSLHIDKPLPPGTYIVRYRVNFRDGGAVTEGETDFVVKKKELAARDSSAK